MKIAQQMTLVYKIVRKSRTFINDPKFTLSHLVLISESLFIFLERAVFELRMKIKFFTVEFTKDVISCVALNQFKIS